jgi:tetratricopeptide (TPR) repeat protein
MPTRTALTVLIVSLAAVAAPRAQGSPSNRAKVQAYRAAIAEYRSGRREASIEIALSWTRDLGFVKELPAGILAIEERKGRADDLEWRDVEAAVLLHTDAATAAVFREPPVQWWKHLDAARMLNGWLARLDQTRPRGGLPPYSRAYQARVWYLATLVSFSRLWQHSTIEAMADEAAEQYPGDADIQLAAGAVSERLAYYRGSSFGGTRARRKAGDRYRAAVAAGPGIHEAVVRLGHVLAASGRKREAEVEFRQAIRDARDPRVLYLAHLFLGRLLENDRQFVPAADEYAAAVASQPDAQAARSALAHVKIELGRIDEAWPALEPGLDSALPQNDFADPFCSYGMGPLVDLEALLLGMRDAVRR